MKPLNLLILVIAFVLFSCDRPKHHGVSSAPVISDVPPAEDSEEDPGVEHSPDFYVNGIKYFPETNEFYVSLPFKDPADYEKIKELRGQADSVVFEDEETVRERLPADTARKYFDLMLLDQIDIYDYARRFISSAKFVRVEYYQPPVESSFIAVFKPDAGSAFGDRQYYCLSPVDRKFQEITTATRGNPALTGRIMREFDIKVRHEWASRHTEIDQDKCTLSILSARVTGEEHPVSYLTQLKDGRLKLLHKHTGRYIFLDFLPLPVRHNRHPVLLMTIAVPQTDSSPYFAPFVWEKDGYKMEKNKFYLKGD